MYLFTLPRPKIEPGEFDCMGHGKGVIMGQENLTLDQESLTVWDMARCYYGSGEFDHMGHFKMIWVRRV